MPTHDSTLVIQHDKDPRSLSGAFKLH